MDLLKTLKNTQNLLRAREIQEHLVVYIEYLVAVGKCTLDTKNFINNRSMGSMTTEWKIFVAEHFI